jgi:hypothetical protein
MSASVIYFASTTRPDEKGIITNIQRSIIQSGVNAALNNSGVMRHVLNTNYYANHSRPDMAIRQGAAAAWDAISGSRR